MAQPQLANQGIAAAPAERLTPTAMLKDQWNMVKELVAADIGANHAKSWINPLDLLGLEGMTLVLGSPNTFAKDWIENHYLDALVKAWKQVNVIIQEVKIVIAEPQVTVANTNSVAATPQIKVVEAFDSFEKDEPGSSYTGAPLDNRFTFENFVVGKPNELAYAAALRVAESSTPNSTHCFYMVALALVKLILCMLLLGKFASAIPTARLFIYLLKNSCISLCALCVTKTWYLLKTNSERLMC